MKKNTCATLFFLCAAWQVAISQLPYGAIAPDFTATDLEGNSHHLYEVLENDKIVILEVSATWCAPCWAYHQGHDLQDLYEVYGPDGEDKLEVFWVEGDPNTNQACIFGPSGCNNVTAGNYAAGTPYPLFNNAVIANLYNISYYPTLFIICPNKKTYEVAPLSAENLWEKAQVCPVADGSNNAGIFAHDPGYNLPELCNSVSLAPQFTLTNLGSEPLKDASIFIKWNGNFVQTIEWTGNLATYEEATIQFDSFQVNAAGILNTVISSINNNAGDDDFTNNYANNSYTDGVQFDQTQVVLKIRTDEYGEETYWELRDENNMVLESGGNQLIGGNGGGAFPLGIAPGPGSYPNNTLIRDTLALPAAGCYSLHFVDSYGDGICCDYGNGYFKLYNIDNPVTPILTSGQFEDYERHAFFAGTTSSVLLSGEEKPGLALYPNPAHGFLYVELQEPADLQVLDATGRIVKFIEKTDINVGAPVTVSLDKLPNGLYFLSTSTNGQIKTTNKFIILN